MIPTYDPACRRCPLWENARTVCIPGEGPLDSEVLVLGIAPGGREDSYRQGPSGVDWMQGRPFVGESGVLLRGVLLSNGLAVPDARYPDHPRPLVRLTNVNRCRPPENRDPSADEMRACRTYLESELAAMTNLKYVVALGSLPMKALGVPGSVTDLAGVPRKTEIAGRVLTVIPVFHPAAILRRQTYLSTWESHWHQIRNIVKPDKVSLVDKIQARIYQGGLQGQDWRSL